MIDYILAGVLGTINMILWGLYGDLLVEKFDFKKVLRSILFGVFWSLFLFYLNPDLSLFIICLSTISLERITTEIYKAFLRNENQDKYKIPSDFNFKYNYLIKFIIGIFLLYLVGFLLYFLNFNINNFFIILSIGLFIALGGMLKDAPYEGFDLIKFFRSPIVAIGVGLVLIYLFPSIESKYLLLATAGGERIVSEFYKKILKGRIPGKFKEKEFDSKWLSKRKFLLPFYVLNIISIISLYFYN